MPRNEALTTLRSRASAALGEGGIRLLLTKVARRTRTRVTLWPASRALRKQVGSASGIDSCLDVAFGFRYDRLSLAPQQIRSEITSLLELVQSIPPRIVLEIGTASGATLMLFGCVSDQHATLITVDLPLGVSRERLHRAAAGPDQSTWTVRADSHAPETKAFIENLLLDKPVDLLFIDGDHSYQGVKTDYVDYSPLVRSGGLIAFHDIVPGPEEYVGGVPQFWQEVKEGRVAHEFVESWSQGGLGIGVIENT